ncbi:hypothetical protein C8R44DRAFT_896694 [Mycena epipterygia]|nr:hypothetical protein C8R44DRAFT_896694 [Mycena epipterygia]
MFNISPALLVLVSLIPNNNIRYAMLALGASITVLYRVNLQRPSFRLAHLEDSVGGTEEIIREAKALCSRDHLSLTNDEVSLLKVRRSMCILRSTLLQIPGMNWTLEGFKNYRRLRRDIYQCEKEVKRIQVAVQLTVEAERERKYTGDIWETEAIVTAVRDPRGTIAHSHHGVSYILFGAQLRAQLRVQLRVKLEHEIVPISKLDVKSCSGSRFDIQLRAQLRVPTSSIRFDPPTALSETKRREMMAQVGAKLGSKSDLKLAAK